MLDVGDEPENGHTASLPSIPLEGYILPLFGTVIYPQTVTALAINQQSAVRLVDAALEADGVLTLVALRAERMRPATVNAEACHAVGTVALIHRLLRLPDNTLRIAAEGIERVRMTNISVTDSGLYGRFEPWADHLAESGEVQPLLIRAIEQTRNLSRFLPILTNDLQLALANEESPQRLSYLLAMSVTAHSSVAERQALLELDSVPARLNRLIGLLGSELERVQRRLPDEHGAQSADISTLDRRPELRELPLIQEALETGRLDGMRSLLTALLRDRFSDDARLIAVEERLMRITDRETLQRLALLAARAGNLQEVADHV